MQELGRLSACAEVRAREEELSRMDGYPSGVIVGSSYFITQIMARGSGLDRIKWMLDYGLSGSKDINAQEGGLLSRAELIQLGVKDLSSFLYVRQNSILPSYAAEEKLKGMASVEGGSGGPGLFYYVDLDTTGNGRKGGYNSFCYSIYFLELSGPIWELFDSDFRGDINNE